MGVVESILIGFSLNVASEVIGDGISNWLYDRKKPPFSFYPDEGLICQPQVSPALSCYEELAQALDRWAEGFIVSENGLIHLKTIPQNNLVAFFDAIVPCYKPRQTMIVRHEPYSTSVSSSHLQACL